jgi:hypothetical protein
MPFVVKTQNVKIVVHGNYRKEINISFETSPNEWEDVRLLVFNNRIIKVVSTFNNGTRIESIDNLHEMTHHYRYADDAYQILLARYPKIFKPVPPMNL